MSAPPSTRAVLLRQFETAWLLTGHHLTTLTTEECLWRPASRGLHLHREADGSWRPEWPSTRGTTSVPPWDG